MSMAVRLTYFVHATTTDNARNIASGWRDVDLSEQGIQQAEALGGLTRDRHFDAIFCSDLIRAVRTAQLAWGTACRIIPDRRLRECNYGTYTGQPADIVEPVLARLATTPMPEGESLAMVEDRIAAFLAQLRPKYDGKKVAIVAHKAPQLALDVLLREMSWEQALANDWRRTKTWQPGWPYLLA